MNNRIAVAGVHPAQNLHHPPLNLAGRDPAVPFLLGGLDDGGEVGGQVLEHQNGVFIVAPEVLVEEDDIRAVLERLEGLDLAEGGLVVVHLLQGDGGGVGAAAGLVDVGVGAGAHALEDFVLGGDLAARVDAPALRRRLLHSLRLGGTRSRRWCTGEGSRR